MIARIVRANAVLPGEEPPILDGAIVYDDTGTILDVGRAADILPRHEGAAIETVPGVLLPGLVNAHAHLELSGLRGKVSGGSGFVPWVEKMMGTRAAEHPEEDGAAVDRACAELDLLGTAAIADVTNTLSTVHALARHNIAGIVFHELLGMESARALGRFTSMQSEAAALQADWPSPRLSYAPAIHGLYSTHRDAVLAVLQYVRARGLSTSIHLAEHAAERAFLMQGEGPFAMLADRMRWPHAGFVVPKLSPVDAAERLGLLAPDVLLVHLTDVRARELDLVAGSAAPVVLCPRSNLFIELKLPPLTEILHAGIVPALGTDSLASNSSLDVLSEAKALAERFPSVPKHTLIRMATAAGADALGRLELGRLARGKRPGIVLVEGDLQGNTDPSAWVLSKHSYPRRWIVRAS